MRLDGKVALITGAGSGMGRVATHVFAREGARVIAVDLDERAGRETESTARADRLEVQFVRADVAHEADCRAMVEFAAATYGRLDVLYNNAGVFPQADHSVTDTDEAVWDQVLAVNIKGVAFGCKYGIPLMQRSGTGGSIINIASFVALVGCSVPQDAYTASKGAVIALTKSLAVQFGPQGIRSNAICPGPIETPLMTSWLLTNPEAKAVRLARNPSGRFGQPEDIVNLALYLASDESTWTNGAVMVVDGGITSNYF
jgi:NAD(P)-dependent dehydrogenase (short-subunit alcohol dehydrogenase family)